MISYRERSKIKPGKWIFMSLDSIVVNLNKNEVKGWVGEIENNFSKCAGTYAVLT